LEKVNHSKEVKKVAWTGGHTSSDWFGAIIVYYWNRKQIAFKDIYNNKYWVRNAFIGWTLKMILLFSAIAIGFFIYY
jgi:hypothetical protein